MTPHKGNEKETIICNIKEDILSDTGKNVQ